MCTEMPTQSNYLLSFVENENLYNNCYILRGVTYRLSRLSEFDRIIGNDRIDVCLNVFTSALIVRVVAWRSTGLLMARIFRLLSFTSFHELCLALASLGLFISLHKYSVIFEEIEDCR